LTTWPTFGVFARGAAVPDARAADGEVDGRRVRLLKPQTFMNLSGDALASVRAAAILVGRQRPARVVDDVALPLGTFRFRARARRVATTACAASRRRWARWSTPAPHWSRA